jgi:hypothetical protein
MSMATERGYLAYTGLVNTRTHNTGTAMEQVMVSTSHFIGRILRLLTKHKKVEKKISS